MSLTIYDIKYATLKNQPYYFDRKTMKFFGQRMSDFKIVTSWSGRVFIYAPLYFYDSRIDKNTFTGWSIREFTGKDLICLEDSGIDMPKGLDKASRERVKEYLKNIY